MDIYTIGHSTHSSDEFSSLLKSYDIEALVDVRSYPSSNHMPQFNKEDIKKWLPESGISYLHMPSLGGRRKKRFCYMCSESVPWRCHRLIISNTLALKGLNVHHIMTEKKTTLHEIGMYGAKAVIEGSTLIYSKQLVDNDNEEGKR